MQLQPGRWSFPYLESHLIAMHEPDGDFALIDDAADELFAQPLNELPPQWYAHLRMERNCLLITGIDLQLATTSMEGVHSAVERGDAFGAMVLINDGSVLGD